MSAAPAAGRLREACAEFEAALLRQMVEASGIGRNAFANDDGDADSPSAIAGMSDLFAEALARAVEHAGGVGLGLRLSQALEARER